MQTSRVSADVWRRLAVTLRVTVLSEPVLQLPIDPSQAISAASSSATWRPARTSWTRRTLPPWVMP